MGYNALRAQNRRQTYEYAAGKLDLQPTTLTGAETLVEQAEQRRLVRRALAQMKPRAAQILVLRYAGCSYAEIAATLKITAGSVGSLLARAEAEFQKRYEKIERGG
jgi:RNA polymerase sigma-70 factor (ECF subfamily)